MDDKTIVKLLKLQIMRAWNFRLVLFCNTIINVALIAGIIHAATWFHEPKLLWFLLLLLLTTIYPNENAGRKKGDKENEDG